METADLGTFTCRRGDRFDLPILGEEDGDGTLMNLATYGSSWTSQLRARANDEDPAATFTVDQANISGAVDPGRDAPQLILTLPGSVTANLTARPYVFDVQVTGGPASPLTLYCGTLTIVADVTRP